MKHASQSATIILKLLNDQKFCPQTYNQSWSISTVFSLAVRNKVVPVLKHFLVCHRCQKATNKNWQTKIQKTLQITIFRGLYLQQELREVHKLFKQHRIRGVLFKWLSTTPLSGSDIDILVSKPDFTRILSIYQKRGYVIETTGREHKEAHLIHPLNGIQIDLHFLFAYPHFRGLTSHDLSLLQRISHLCLQTNQASDFGLSYPSIEWFIAMKIAGYWYNDLLTGIGSLHTLMRVCKQQNDSINWREFLLLIKKLHCKQEALFVLAVGSRLFKSPLPTVVVNATPWYVKLLALTKAADAIIIFPPIKSWYYSKYYREAKGRFLRFLLLKLVLQQHIPWSEIVKKFRPQKIRAWGPVLLQQFSNKK